MLLLVLLLVVLVFEFLFLNECYGILFSIAEQEGLHRREESTKKTGKRGEMEWKKERIATQKISSPNDGSFIWRKKKKKKKEMEWKSWRRI